MDTSIDTRRKLFGLALIIAPILLGLSTFFWQGRVIGMAGGVLGVYAFTFWAPALFGLLSLVQERMPSLGTWGILLVVFACIGGANWAMDGILAQAYPAAGSGVVTGDSLFVAMGVAGVLVLQVPGLLFPVTLITIGIALLRTRAVPSWCAITLLLGAVAFPASRIPRIEMLAHVADLLLLVPTVWLGLHMLRTADGKNALADARANVA
jgi:hypothetical protein